jgi:hypothetical protein
MLDPYLNLEFYFFTVHLFSYCISLYLFVKDSGYWIHIRLFHTEVYVSLILLFTESVSDQNAYNRCKQCCLHITGVACASCL